MATLLIRSGGIRSIPRLRLHHIATKRYIKTQNVLKRPKDFGGSGGRTFQNAIHETTPKSEYHNTPPANVRGAIGALLLGVVGVGAYLTQKKNVRADSPNSGLKKLPVYKKDEVAHHKTKEAGIWE